MAAVKYALVSTSSPTLYMWCIICLSSHWGSDYILIFCCKEDPVLFVRLLFKLIVFCIFLIVDNPSVVRCSLFNNISWTSAHLLNDIYFVVPSGNNVKYERISRIRSKPVAEYLYTPAVPDRRRTLPKPNRCWIDARIDSSFWSNKYRSWIT